MKKGGHLTPEGLDQIKRIIERDTREPLLRSGFGPGFW